MIVCSQCPADNSCGVRHPPASVLGSQQPRAALRQLLSQSCSCQTTCAHHTQAATRENDIPLSPISCQSTRLTIGNCILLPSTLVDNKTPIAAVDRSLSRSCPRAGAASSDAIITATPTTNEPFLNLAHTRISLARLPAPVQHGVDRELAVINIHDWIAADSIAQVFRIAADLSHITAKCILIFSIHRNRSSEGGLPNLYSTRPWPSLTLIVPQVSPS